MLFNTCEIYYRCYLGDTLLQSCAIYSLRARNPALSENPATTAVKYYETREEVQLIPLMWKLSEIVRGYWTYLLN